MELTETQFRDYQRDGYLFVPGLFSPAEAAVLRAEADRLYATEREEVWHESSGAPRTAFAAHEWSEPFRRLGRHPRLIGPVRRLLGGPVYMHQYKVNAKAAFDGEVWQWHQDYGTWQRDDDMPEPLAMNIAGEFSRHAFQDQCSCQRSSRPGEANSTRNALASPPLRVPLFITATRGCSACTSAGEPDFASPWCEVR